MVNMNKKFIGGTERTALTSQLLDLIIMVQSYKDFKIYEKMFKKSHDIFDENYINEVEQYFNSIGDEILSKYKLSTNRMSLDKVVNFRVTNEMLTANSNELPEKFMF